MVDRDAAAPVRVVDVTELPSRMQEQVKTYEPSETSIIGTSVIGAPTVLVNTGNLGTVAVGDVVNIKSGTNVTVGYYTIISIGGAPDNVTLNAVFTVVGDGADIVYDVYDTLNRQEDGVVYATDIRAFGTNRIAMGTDTVGVDLPLAVGQANAAGAGPPAAGTYALGDKVVDLNGIVWQCTVAGTPGSWSTHPISLVFTHVFGDWTPSGGVATDQLVLFALPAGGEIVSAFYEVDTLFTDVAPPLGATTLSIGTAGAAADIQTAQAVDDTGATGIKSAMGAGLTTNRAVYSTTAPTNIIAEMTIAGGKFLNALTAGEVDYYITYIIHSV